MAKSGLALHYRHDHKFPNLEYLGTQIGGTSGIPSRPTRMRNNTNATGKDRVATVGMILQVRLNCASLDFLLPLIDVVQIHHSKPLPNLVEPKLGQNTVSTSLRIMTNHPRELQSCVMVDETRLPSRAHQWKVVIPGSRRQRWRCHWLRGSN
ncbi:hypothetical protein HBI70_152900 [Parastagonospora nodorum]|nr:hypothetical protein HBH51_045940 [Parastagonospora nodorum]KAH4069927.1 hypothetical protein HBH50_106320 [Parastagonospora nodorum]KAH4090334.1 hypothetical protein HBH48_110090 [Parastagonospora nodorum]KAH5099164.1 hypothetical protein HBH71_237270 [Parastagonospora nodorum]KAH5264188.1 hypothetical protein HBI70_152900 [Parastagonospora nodorum]